MNTTDDFERGQRVKVAQPGNVLDGENGTVITRDAFTVRVRFDRITPAMKDYQDSNEGVCEVSPEHLMHL